MIAPINFVYIKMKTERFFTPLKKMGKTSVKAEVNNK